jgi:hypothetical protein
MIAWDGHMLEFIEARDALVGVWAIPHNIPQTPYDLKIAGGPQNGIESLKIGMYVRDQQNTHGRPPFLLSASHSSLPQHDREQ